MRLSLNRGFSLIELMVSIVVLVVVVGVLARVLDTFTEITSDQTVVLNGTVFSVAPSNFVDVSARNLMSQFVDDLFRYPFAYVVGGLRLDPTDLSLVGTPLRPLTTSPTLSLSEYPSSSRLFEAQTSSDLPQYGSRTFPDNEFSVVFLDGLTSVQSVYHVYKGSGTAEGVTYNTYEVLYQDGTNPATTQLSYSYAIPEVYDGFVNQIGATHRYHRYDPVWGIEEQDSTMVIFPDPIITSSGIDQTGNVINSVSRFVYEIVF